MSDLELKKIAENAKAIMNSPEIINYLKTK